MKMPSERQWVTIGLFGLTVFLLGMAHYQPKLWAVDTFKSILQVVIVTGLINMVGAFHFAANKSDETKSENTAKAFDAITATANATTPATVTIDNTEANPVPVEGLFRKLRALAPVIKLLAPKVPIDAVLEIKDAIKAATKKKDR